MFYFHFNVAIQPRRYLAESFSLTDAAINILNNLTYRRSTYLNFRDYKAHFDQQFVIKKLDSYFFSVRSAALWQISYCLNSFILIIPILLFLERLVHFFQNRTGIKLSCSAIPVYN